MVGDLPLPFPDGRRREGSLKVIVCVWLEGGYLLVEFYLKFYQGFLPLEAVATPRDDFRTGILPGIPPLESIASPEFNFRT